MSSGIPDSSICLRYSSAADASSSPSAALHVVADPAADLQHGQTLTLKADRQGEAIDDVELLEQLDLLLVAQIGGVAGGVSQRTGLVDRAQERANAIVGVSQVEDLLDHGAVLALLGADAVVALCRVVVRGDLDAKRAVDVWAGRAGDAAAYALDGYGLRPARQLQAVVDLGDGADGGERVVLAGNEKDLVRVADVDRQRQVHPGEDDDVVEGN
jgi:hypothetical protein